MEESNCLLDFGIFFLLAGERVQSFDMSFFLLRRTEDAQHVVSSLQKEKTKKGVGGAV